MNSQTENKICQNCKKDFIIEPEDFNFYEKIKVPPPTWCFDCRLKRRLAFLNERTLFKRKCDQCSKDIIAMYSPQSEFKVFCTSCYLDREDTIQYGVEYDFSKTFFEQFNQLLKRVPRQHMAHKNNNAERCEYANYTYHGRNVYLSYAVVRSEDIYYSKQVLDGNKICVDCDTIHLNERGYELVGSSRSYNSRFLVRSTECVDSAFLFNCKNCTNCCMSSNLTNKSYVFRNKQLSREEYMEAMKSFPLDSYAVQEKLKNEFWDLSKSALCRFANMKNVENCTGDFIGNSKNTHYSFENVDTENSKYIVFATNTVKDSYDLLYVGKTESCYELINAGSINNHALFGLDIGTCHDVQYCTPAHNSKNLFGCIALKNKEYCILNKQYSKEEYEKLLPKIIQQMNDMPYVDKKGRVYKYGEFFPIEFSPFAYNESLAYEEFPMSKEGVLAHGYVWRDSEDKHYADTIEINELPDSINDVTDGILEKIIACPNKGQIETKCTFAYRIMPDELRFYRLMKIPLPRYCPNCRYFERKKWKNPWKLWHRQCMCNQENHIHKGHCQNEFETSYAPDRPEVVYCEKCYQQEVY